MDRLEAAIIDGTAQTPRFRYRQLTYLHNALNTSRSNIVEAVCDDLKYTPTEAQVEFHLTMSTIQTLHEQLNVKTLLKDEYSLADSKDHSSQRIPYGCAYIVGSTTMRLYSTVVPIATAIAAGNCVALEIQQTLSRLGQLLKDVLISALDNSTFITVNNSPHEQFLERHCIQFDTKAVEKPKTTVQTLTIPSGRVVAILDRSGDVETAAREIVRARFAFAGQSSYAPDVVLVNEYSMKAFCKAVGKHAMSFIAGNVETKSTEHKSIGSSDEAGSRLQKELEKDNVTVLLSGSRGTVAVVHDRQSTLLKTKITKPMLLIHPVTSLDDAIDLVNSSGESLVAHFPFAAPAAAKYLSQFIDSRMSYVNHIPVELLVGTAAPVGYAASVQPRYTMDMFSKAKPEYISISARSVKLAEVLDKADGTAEEMVTRLEADTEPKGEALGFFDQGIRVGGITLLSVIAGGAVLTWKFARPLIAKVGR